jgi:hypothetical protein
VLEFAAHALASAPPGQKLLTGHSAQAPAGAPAEKPPKKPGTQAQSVGAALAAGAEVFGGQATTRSWEGQ